MGTERTKWGIDAEAETKQLVNLQGSRKKAGPPRESPQGSHMAPGGFYSPDPT